MNIGELWCYQQRRRDGDPQFPGWCKEEDEPLYEMDDIFPEGDDCGYEEFENCFPEDGYALNEPDVCFPVDLKYA